MLHSLTTSTPRQNRRHRLLLVIPMLVLSPVMARAQSLTAKDVQIVGKALGFLDPAAATGVVAVVYNPADPASKQDADAITEAFGGGISGASSSYTAKSVSTADLGDGTGYVDIIAASGAAGDQTVAAAHARKMLCITGDKTAVQAGKCVMTVSSDPTVAIEVSTSAASAAGVSFASAFRMMITEI